MDKDAIINEVKEIIGNYLQGKGIDLVDLVYRREGRGLVLRLLVDKPSGGISLYECAQLNTGISAMMDEREIFKDSYMLEVSSPGIDRPLARKSDFLRCINRKARFFLTEEVGGKREWEGAITGADDNCVYVDAPGVSLEIPLSKIAKAKQTITGNP